MTSVFPRAVMDQLAWRPRVSDIIILLNVILILIILIFCMMKQVPMTPLGPSGFPHDLERFRPVEREEVKD